MHPSLYPYIAGVTPVLQNDGIARPLEVLAEGKDGDAGPRQPADEVPAEGGDRGDTARMDDTGASLPYSRRHDTDGESHGKHKRFDRWGRNFTESKFSWLPAELKVRKDGICRFTSYINNLPMNGANDSLYRSLEDLFALFLPMFQATYAYVGAVHFPEQDEIENDGSVDEHYEPDHEAASLLGKKLRVVCKIADYVLKHGDTFDGVWHVEGMSHESIVMTGLYILERHDHFDGGDILFKVRPQKTKQSISLV